MTDYTNILFVDIETASNVENYELLEDNWKTLWDKKAQYYLRSNPDLTIKSAYSSKAAIHAEFSRVVCISIAYINTEGSEQEIRVKSFSNSNEKQLLQAFCALLDSYYDCATKFRLCGHNIKEFDIPFLCRRMLINGVALPELLQLSGKRSYEVKHVIDTMDLWKFGDYKNFSSLSLLAAVMGLPSSKDEIDGSDVHEVYYVEKDIEKIVRYCEKDVALTAQIYQKLIGNEVVCSNLCVV